MRRTQLGLAFRLRRLIAITGRSRSSYAMLLSMSAHLFASGVERSMHIPNIASRRPVYFLGVSTCSFIRNRGIGVLTVGEGRRGQPEEQAAQPEEERRGQREEQAVQPEEECERQGERLAGQQEATH